MATTAGLVTRCKSRYNDPNNAILADADWVAYLNDAYSWVQANPGVGKWPFSTKQNKTLVATAAASGVVLVDADLGELSVVFDVTDSYVLEPMPSPDEAFIQFPVQTDTGSPAYYRLRNNTIELFPHPSQDTTLWVEYEGPLPALVSSSVDPSIPDRHCQTLVEYALYLAYEDDDDNDTAQIHLQTAMALLKGMQADLTINRTARNQQIVDTFWRSRPGPVQYDEMGPHRAPVARNCHQRMVKSPGDVL